MGKEKGRVVVAMSGGVDSSAAAAALVEEGYEVIGLTMHLWDHGLSTTMGGRTCCAPEDVQDARHVAQRLDIPFYVINLEEAFQHWVVDDFCRAYAVGRTPNPCVRCNQYLKFDLLLQRARALGADFLATGHYALRRLGERGCPQLWRSPDHRKDQSYFLFSVTPAQLDFLRFPVGALSKEETRRLALRFGLPVAGKRESQDLCFVPDGNYAAFFAQHAPHLLQPGPITDGTGKQLGEHRGLGCYTIGQRRGLGIAAAQPLYVVAIDAVQNRLVVGPETALWQEQLTLSELNWLDEVPLREARPLLARIRYAAEPEPAWAIPLAAGGVQVRFQQPQRAVTPGQACVFYEGERLLGGGWIDAVHEKS